jgi:anti-sigma factor RsiW
MMSDVHCIREILLSTYLDGELSGNDFKQVTKHLANCRDCSDAYERMQADRDSLLECLPDVAPPEYVKQKLFRKINEVAESRRCTGIRSWLGIGHILHLRSRALIAACASIMVFAVMLSVFQYQRHLENNMILAEIDHSRAEWAAQDSSTNPFDIDAKEERARVSGDNPFQSYLSER